ncbi:MAG: MoaD/ThiS family protein [Candidatus Bathyarchaeota archaeon]|nr:MoaD/ThiS family protein [Candidatus Bathyarchaeota archaeon]
MYKLLVNIRYYSMARDATGRKLEQVELPEGSTMRSLIHRLVENHGDELDRYVYDQDGELRDYLMYSVNDIDIVSLDGYDTLLSDGDTVLVLPPIGGG